jgi:hypothetical protein
VDVHLAGAGNSADCLHAASAGKTPANSLPDTKANLAASKPRHSAKWWASKMAGQDFDKEDDLDTVNYNLVLWQGMKGKRVAYPQVRSGADLSANRDLLLQPRP